jgi:tetratricopeptide (TPR) repeat protein
VAGRADGLILVTHFVHAPVARAWRLVVACALLSQAPWALAQDDRASDLQFGSGLVKWGFPDYALKYADDLASKHPELGARVAIVRVEAMVAGRRFADAEGLLKSLGADPKADAVRVALGNGYYAAGEIDKARAIYSDLFKKYAQPPSDPDVLTFYREAAYAYGRMMENANDPKGAAQAYERLLASKPEEDVARKVMSEVAQLYVRVAREAEGKERDQNIEKAQKLCKELVYGGTDIWFGQAITTMANIELLRGKRADAQKVLNQYTGMLKDIDKALEEQGFPLSESPMAAVRFMNGELYQKDAEAVAGDPAKKEQAIALYAKAINEFINVFARYGQSAVGPDAGVRANAIKQILEKKYGKQVKWDFGDKAEEVVSSQLRLADSLFREKKYAEASKEYLRAINQFPEARRSIAAAGLLLQCYADLNEDLFVKAVAGYLGERFGDREEAANALLALGKFYVDRKDAERSRHAYETYLASCPKHAKAATILFYLASERRKAGDEQGAAEYFQRIVDNYKQDQYYPKAASQLAWSYHKAGDYEKAAGAFEKLVGELPAGPDRALAQFTRADCFVRLEKWPEAVAELEKLISWLAPKDNPYAVTAADAEKNRGLLEKTVFQRANCYARISSPADAIAAAREKALKGYDQFIALFPKSDLAPKAMSGRGRVQLELKEFDAAAKTFDELAAKYPASDEGKNALFSLARSAMEIKQYDTAKGAFAKMMQNKAAYGPEEFVRIGSLMAQAGLFEPAMQAFEQVLKDNTVQDRATLERALFGVGQAYSAAKRYEDAAKSLEDLLTRYPKSGLFYDAKFLLGEAYGEMGRFGDASLAIGDVMRFTTNNLLATRASLSLSGIQRKAGDLPAALASYKRIELLANPSDSELRPMIQEAILAAIPLAMELRKYQDAMDSCDQFLKLFPRSEKVEQVRKWRSEANLKASEGPAAAPAPQVAPQGAPP